MLLACSVPLPSHAQQPDYRAICTRQNTDASQYEVSIVACTRWVSRRNLSNRDRAIGFDSRATANTYVGDFESALRDFGQAIQADPTYARPFFDRANAYADLGQHERAISDYDQVIRLEPDNAVALNYRGVAYMYVSVERAIEDFNQAIGLNPDLAHVL
jgi:tetratricopeptide (TPR) repeat protein